jgi:hypothetical protein
MDKDEHLLATDCYGYGSWNADYWFIGPEQGQGGRENGVITDRAKAHSELAVDGLSDCREFHSRIGEGRWHKDDAALQSTWRSLILLLLAFQGKLTKFTSVETRKILQRDYQRNSWGISDGETCVVELSGLPAQNLAVKKDRVSFRQGRLDYIHKKILANEPKFVVIYGKSHRKYWQAVADDIRKSGQTHLYFTPHPVYGPGNQYWIELGLEIARDLKP